MSQLPSNSKQNMDKYVCHLPVSAFQTYSTNLYDHTGQIRVSSISIEILGKIIFLFFSKQLLGSPNLFL